MPTYNCPECNSVEGSTVRRPDGGHHCPTCKEKIAESQSDLAWSDRDG